MRCSHTEFQEIAAAHRRAIQQRGFARPEQVKCSRNPARRAWWRISRALWEGYRTYWRARSAGGAPVFVKVYFGNNPPEASIVDGENECALHAHFAPFVGSVDGVRMLSIVEHWRVERTYFVASEWTGLSTITLQEALRVGRTRRALAGLLAALAKAPAPAGWDRSRETHNWADTDYEQHSFGDAAPFDTDLPLNLAVDEAGALVFHDFEKFQWATRGLQEAHLAAWACLTALRRGDRPLGQPLADVIGHLERASCDSLSTRCRWIADQKLRGLGARPTSDEEWACVGLTLASLAR